MTSGWQWAGLRSGGDQMVGEEVGDTVSEVCLQNLELALDSSMPTS